MFSLIKKNPFWPFTFIFIFIVICSINFLSEKPAPEIIPLDNILDSGSITLITRNNTHCYYTYREQAMGFEYDLSKEFADFLGVKLNVVIADNLEAMTSLLMNEKGHFIGASMTDLPGTRGVSLSDGYMLIRQHIIINRKSRKIKSIEKLKGKTIHIGNGTSHYNQLEILKHNGINLKKITSKDMSEDDLIQKVAEGKIDITIAHSNVAYLNRRYHPKAIVSLPVGEKKHLKWAVKANSPKLLDKINIFFETIKKNGKFTTIYNRYYSDIDSFNYVDLNSYHKSLNKRLPRYSNIIKSAAKKYDFDWRLIAAQIYQESHFNPRARSRSNALGMMQLTSTTAESLGVTSAYDPEQNIYAGVKYLRKLYDLFDKAEDKDRLYLALAAYNVGQGHVLDARNIAREMNLDPNKWSSLSKTLPMLKKEKYFMKAKYGYCRGTETVNYIKQIKIFYDILKHKEIMKI